MLVVLSVVSSFRRKIFLNNIMLSGFASDLDRVQLKYFLGSSRHFQKEEIQLKTKSLTVEGFHLQESIQAESMKCGQII